MKNQHRFVLVAVLLAAGCKGRAEEREESTRARVDDAGRIVLTQEEQKAIGLEVVPAAQGSLLTSALRFGKVVARPQEDALVTAPITGRLVAPTLTLGATVSADDVLVTLEPLVDTASRATLEAQRRELAGQVEGARAQAEAKQKDVSRVTTLVSSGLATEADRAQAEASLTAERARVESLRRAGGELARMTGGRLELRAPAPGVIATLVTDAGSVIQQGAVVARIIRVGPRWIDISVPPGDGTGSSYRAEGTAGAVPVSLVARGSVIQPDGTRRDRLEAAPEAAAGLPPGVTVSVEVLHETQGVVVPVTAVVRRGRETVLFIEAGNGRYEPRSVQVAVRDDQRAVIVSGLTTGQRVVTRGVSSLIGELGTEALGRDGGAQE